MNKRIHTRVGDASRMDFLLFNIHRYVEFSHVINGSELCMKKEKWNKNCICDPDLSIWRNGYHHSNDVIMSAMASQITSLKIVYSAVYSGTYQRKYQSSGSLAFFRGIHRWPVNSPHKGPVTRKMFPFDGVIDELLCHVRHRNFMCFSCSDFRCIRYAKKENVITSVLIWNV